MNLYEEHEFLKSKLEKYQEALKINYRLRKELEQGKEQECQT